MIVYLDTSSLVKLYVEEAGSDHVHGWVSQAGAVATSRVAYPEAMAAFARRHRDGTLPKEGFKELLQAFARDWLRLAVLDLNEVAAGDLAVKHGLRGFDAIHLDAVLTVHQQARESSVGFSSFDQALNAAAAREGLRILRPEASEK